MGEKNESLLRRPKYGARQNAFMCVMRRGVCFLHHQDCCMTEYGQYFFLIASLSGSYSRSYLEKKCVTPATRKSIRMPTFWSHTRDYRQRTRYNGLTTFPRNDCV